MARMLALALVAAALRGALAQRAGMRPGEEEAEAAWTCEARYNGTSCLLDHLVDAQGRDTWPARGLINGSDLRIYFTEGHHAPVIEDIVHFMRHAFLDENVKSDARMANLFNGPSPPPPPPIRTAGNPLVDVPPPPPVPNAPNRPPAAYLHVLNAGSHDGAISYCYFPMLYYTCAASYQVCKEDTNRTEQLIRNPPPTPANLDLELLPEIEMEWAKTAQTLAMTPVYPCTSFCEDPEVQECKEILLSYMETSLAGLPNLQDYLDNVTDIFNCTRLEGKSAAAARDDGDLCLLRPDARSPPPPPPLVPPAPALPPAPTSGARRPQDPLATAAAAAFVAAAASVCTARRR